MGVFGLPLTSSGWLTFPSGDGKVSHPERVWCVYKKVTCDDPDALAIGFSMSILQVSIWFPAFVIGVVASAFTIAGMYVGSKARSSDALSYYAEILGGIVLFGIGISILYDHRALQQICIFFNFIFC
jgi:Putative manganese efflux pump